MANVDVRLAAEEYKNGRRAECDCELAQAIVTMLENWGTDCGDHGLTEHQWERAKEEMLLEFDAKARTARAKAKALLGPAYDDDDGDDTPDIREEEVIAALIKRGREIVNKELREEALEAPKERRRLERRLKALEEEKRLLEAEKRRLDHVPWVYAALK